MEQRSPEWFQSRRNRLTGSNVGAALGINPFKTPDDLIRQMVRNYHGAEPEFKGNVATDWGTNHEPEAALEYTMETGSHIEVCGFFEFEDWLGASPDGQVLETGLIEIKCPYGQRKKNPPQFKTIHEQPHYFAQMQIEMLCANRQWCDFFQWAPHGTMIERVHADVHWVDYYLPKLYEFYLRYVAERDNPDHLEPKLKEVNNQRVRQLVEEYHDLSEVIDVASERRKEVLQTLVSASGERDALVCGHKLTKVKRQGSISYAKVLKDHAPDVDLDPYRGKSSEFWKLTRSVK